MAEVAAPPRHGEDDAADDAPAADAHRRHAAVAEGFTGQEHRHDGAHGRPVRDAQHIGTRQGIAEESLRGQPGQAHAGADGDRQDDPRQADAQNDLRDSIIRQLSPDGLPEGGEGLPRRQVRTADQKRRAHGHDHGRQEDRQEEPDG